MNTHSRVGTVYGPGGSLCYTTLMDLSTATGISTQHHDANDDLVATVDQSLAGSAVLTTRADGTPTVPSSPLATECNPWARPECVKGDCP